MTKHDAQWSRPGNAASMLLVWCMASLASPAVLAGWGVLSRVSVGSPAEPSPAPPDAKPGWTTAVDPKPLSATVKKALEYLVKNQQEDGGWNQGGGWRTTRTPPSARQL